MLELSLVEKVRGSYLFTAVKAVVGFSIKFLKARHFFITYKIKD